MVIPGYTMAIPWVTTRNSWATYGIDSHGEPMGYH